MFIWFAIEYDCHAIASRSTILIKQCDNHRIGPIVRAVELVSQSKLPVVWIVLNNPTCRLQVDCNLKFPAKVLPYYARQVYVPRFRLFPTICSECVHFLNIILSVDIIITVVIIDQKLVMALSFLLNELGRQLLLQTFPDRLDCLDLDLSRATLKRGGSSGPL